MPLVLSSTSIPFALASRYCVWIIFPIRLQNTQNCLNFRQPRLIRVCAMDDTVHLAEKSHCPSSQLPLDLDFEFTNELGDDEVPLASVPTASRGGVRAGGRSNTPRSTPISSQTQAAASHNVRGPNWTEVEMLVLIGQKRIEWDGRHNCNQPSLAKFVYETTAWKLMLVGCMSVASFRARNTDQITNKWDGLMKDYK